LSGVPTLFCEAEGHIMSDEQREPLMNPAQSETPSMLGNSMRENRETPQVSAQGRAARRSQKRKSGMNVCGESSDGIVPTKRVNKRRGTARRSMWREGCRPRRIPRHGPTLDTEPGNLGAL